MGEKKPKKREELYKDVFSQFLRLSSGIELIISGKVSQGLNDGRMDSFIPAVEGQNGRDHSL